MLSGLRFALLLPLAALLACGATPSSPSNGPTPPTYDFSGNWEIDSIGAYALPEFYGPLQFVGDTVTGTLYSAPYIPMYGSGLTACPSSPPTVAVTGTVDASGTLTIAVPLGGTFGTATITTALGANPQSRTNGSYQITGGSCATAATPITIVQYASVVGIYTGTFNELDSNGTPISGATVTVTAVLTQSTPLSGTAYYPLNGTITTSGSCNASYNLSYGFMFGGYSLLGFNPRTGGGILFGPIDPTATTISGSFYPLSPCTLAHYQGTLTRQ